jgi:cyclic pyranopterin phosphate synthase
MPDGIESVPMQQILTFEEIRTVAQAAAANGIRHIKLTGGEPLVRKGLPGLVRILKSIDGIDKVTLTTNGVLLGLFLPELIEAGLDAVNISLDTTDRRTYKEITGSDELGTVLSSLHIAQELGMRVKVNAVSLDLGDDNIRSLIAIAKENPIDVRFIEMMPIGYGRNYETVNHRDLYRKLETMYSGIMIDEREHGFGPAVYYKIPGYRGSIGLISAIHGKFCGTCNRVRLTSQGYLKTCLCFSDGVDLRAILRESAEGTDVDKALRDAIREAVMHKPGEHCFDKPEEITEEAGMNAIGG